MNTTTSDAQDRSDMARLIQGDERALADIMSRHGQMLFHYLIRLVQNETEAADLAQESFVRIFQNCRRFNPDQKLSTWLYAIATNLARDKFRWRSRHPQISLETRDDDDAKLTRDLPTDQPGPHESIMAEERAALVRDALARLPEELRVPLILSEYEQQSHAEIAGALNCSVKAVEMRLYRARQQLRDRLAPLLSSVSPS